MSTIKFKHDYQEMDNKNTIFESNKNIVGVSQIDDSSILITDEVKVVKYEVNSKRVLQEWRTETSGTQFLESPAIHKNNRYYATTNAHTIATWKSTHTYINERSKRFKVVKPCFGLLECMNNVFEIHQDGSLSLFDDCKRTWCHESTQGAKLISFNQISKGQRTCDMFAIILDKEMIKVVKYEIQNQDQHVIVSCGSIEECHSLLEKFDVKKPLKVLFLDELQCVAYGTLKDTNTEGIYLLNARSESVKCYMEFISKSKGDIVQLFRLHDTILVVTSKCIFELDLVYKSPFLCNLIGDELEMEGCINENDMECDAAPNEKNFKDVCGKLKAWLKLKNITSSDLANLESIDMDLHEFFTSLSKVVSEDVTNEEMLALISLVCRCPLNVNAKHFVEMLSFLLSFNDDEKNKEVLALTNKIIESSLPDNMLKSLSTMEFPCAKVLLDHLYNELVADELDTEKVVDWINMVLDSHHTQIMLAKDLEVIRQIKEYVSALCEEAKDDSVKRFVEKLKFNRMLKKENNRGGCYIEIFEL